MLKLVQSKVSHGAAGNKRSGVNGLHVSHQTLVTVHFNSKNKYQMHVHEDAARS